MSSSANSAKPAHANYTRLSVGRLADLRESFPEPALGSADKLGVTAGKVFTGDRLGSKSFELSVHRLLPGQGMPFFHRHKRNEELYAIIRGRGRFILDGEEIQVTEGDFIRVDPAASRSWAAAPDEELVYFCWQVEQGSLQAKVFADGELLADPVPWPTT